jgi:cell division septum initiation protein DivIVA
VQVQNETLTTKLKATEEENKNYEHQVKELSGSVAELKEKLKAAEDKIAGLQSGGEAAALSQVFIEAQKSADMLINNAKAEAEKLGNDAKTAAEATIADANDEAAQIIFEAEREAAVKIAESKNNAEAMNVSTNNLKALMLDDVTKLGAEMTQLRTLFQKFMETGLNDISDAEERLFDVSNTLRDGGVPVFKAPEYFEPEVPEQPKREALIAREEAEDRQKKQDGLDKLKQMAEAIGGKKEKNEAAPAEQKQEAKPEKQEEKKGGKIDLAALAAQANALGGKK